MPRKKKVRDFDYSVEEICKEADIKPRDFNRVLNKLCNRFDINPSMLHIDETLKGSSFIFTPEIGQLLIILIKNFVDKRSNAKESDFLASEIANCYKGLLEDIDNNINIALKKFLYVEKSHYTAELMSEWIEPFMEQLSLFLITIKTIKFQNLGCTIKGFTKALNKLNYNYFEAEYIIKNLLKNNAIEVKSDINETLEYHMENKNLVSIIVDMLKDYIKSNQNIETDDYEKAKKNYEELLAATKEVDPNFKYINNPFKEIFGTNEKPTIEQQRELYFKNEFYTDDINNLYDLMKYNIEKARKDRENWRPINERIESGTYKALCELNLEGRKEKLELEKVNESLNNGDEETEGSNELINNIKKAYSEYCKSKEKDIKKMKDIVDVFVGHVLNEYLT